MYKPQNFAFTNICMNKLMSQSGTAELKDAPSMKMKYLALN